MHETNGRSGSTATVVIKPSRGWIHLNLRDLWRYRELLYFLTWRDIKVRYKQTVIGFLWAFIQPFFKMIVFSVIFGGLAKIDSEGFPYPIFLYAGLLPWQFFASSVNRSGTSVVGGANLIKKVYFPRLVIPVASVGAALIDFAIAFIILIGMMFYYQVVPTASIMMVLPLIVLTILTALGVGMLTSALSAAYRDFQYVLPFFMEVLMFLTPVIYPTNIIPGNWRWLILVNPMTGIIDGYRSAILGKSFEWGNLMISLTIVAVLFLCGLIYFRRTERYFADIV